MSARRRITLAALLAVCLTVVLLPAVALAQCETDSDCRYGRVCREGRCTYPSGACDRDVDCPEGAICESGRCMVAGGTAQRARPEQLLPPPRPGAIRTMRPRRTDGGANFVDPMEWGGRGPLSPRPHGTSVFDFQYGSGDIPCPSGCSECTGEESVNSMQLTLGGDSIIANIVTIGFSMALFRYTTMEGCSLDSFSLGDVQMRIGVLAYHNSGPTHWFGLTPFIRVLMSAGYGSVAGDAGYYAVLEPGVATGFSYRIFSASLHLSALIGFLADDTLGGMVSHITVGLRPINLLGIILGLEVGYGLPGDKDAVPVAMTAGLRLYLGQRVALDVGSRIAFTDEARTSDPNAAYGLWSLGVRLSIVWRGLGRP